MAKTGTEGENGQRKIKKWAKRGKQAIWEKITKSGRKSDKTKKRQEPA